MTIIPDPTSRLTREATPVIVLATTRREYEERMIAFGMDADDPFIYPCYDVDTAHAVATGLPDSTPWCRTGDSVSYYASAYLRQVFGPAVPMSEALNVQNDNIAISPKLLT